MIRFTFGNTLVNPEHVVLIFTRVEPRYENVEGQDDPVKIGDWHEVCAKLLDGSHSLFSRHDNPSDAELALLFLEKQIDRKKALRRKVLR